MEAVVFLACSESPNGYHLRTAHSHAKMGASMGEMEPEKGRTHDSKQANPLHGRGARGGKSTQKHLADTAYCVNLHDRTTK